MSREIAMEHLDAASWKALREHPETQERLLAHLADGCEVCDAFLSSHLDELDGEVDRVLLSLAPPPAAPLDELGWMKLRRRLSGPVGPTRRWAVGVGLAAAVTVALGAVLLGPRGPKMAWDGIKGSSRGPNLQVAAAVKQGDNAFVRLDDGARLGKDAVLVFRADSSVEGPARIYLQRGSTTPVEIGETEVRFGAHEIRTDTGLLGVSLGGEKGELSVWIVVGESPFSNESAIRAIEARGTVDLATARVMVNVE